MKSSTRFLFFPRLFGVGGCWPVSKAPYGTPTLHPSFKHSFTLSLRSTNRMNGRLCHRDLPVTFLQCPRCLFSFLAYELKLQKWKGVLVLDKKFRGSFWHLERHTLFSTRSLLLSCHPHPLSQDLCPFFPKWLWPRTCSSVMHNNSVWGDMMIISWQSIYVKWWKNSHASK